jgi:hypothetical protein
MKTLTNFLSVPVRMVRKEYVGAGEAFLFFLVTLIFFVIILHTVAPNSFGN